MGDMADDFRAMNEHGRQVRKATRGRNTNLIQQFARDYPNVTLEELTEYHFRLASFLDVFPTRQRFHNLTTGKRGRYDTIEQVYHDQRAKAREARADTGQPKKQNAACLLLVGLSRVLPGWGCCKCRVYNGLQRKECKRCGHVPCVTLPKPSEHGLCDECGVPEGGEHVGH